MNKLLLFFGILFCVSCQNKTNNNETKSTANEVEDYLFEDVRDKPLLIDGKEYKLDSISKKDFDAIKYNGLKYENIKLDSSKIYIDNHKMVIYTENGDSVLMINDTIESESMVSYTYESIINKCNSVLLNASYWEWSRSILISLIDGKETYLFDKPNFSPNGKYFITSYPDLESGEMPNGIELFSIDEKLQINQLFEIEIEHWEPIEIKWFSDSIIYIKRAKFDTNHDRIYDYRKIKIIE